MRMAHYVMPMAQQLFMGKATKFDKFLIDVGDTPFEICG